MTTLPPEARCATKKTAHTLHHVGCGKWRLIQPKQD